MSLLDIEEHIINEKWLREEGWISASENPGCLEFRIYIHYGENRLTYIQFLLDAILCRCCSEEESA